jgi:predicted SnoaL-like aldol condensation-catalyzing enzyme
MSHKEMAASFLKMAGGGDVKAAYEKFIAPDFIHHNQYFKGDRQSLMNAMEEAHKKSPNKSIDVKQVLEDGDFVITHSLVARSDPAQAPIAVVHIFRFKHDRVVELWDLGQELVRDSPNENGPF